jgi:TatD DNase family protein
MIMDPYSMPDPHAPCIVYAYRPGHLYLNITNRCTNACVFCSVRHNRGWLGPINLNLAGLEQVPHRVHPSAPVTPCPPASEEEMDAALEAEPDTETILAHLEPFHSSREYPVHEVVFCGSGEPLLRLETVLEVSKALKKRDIHVRINTNGQAAMVHGPDTVARLSEWVDELSISLNAQDASTYVAVSRPSAGLEAYEALLEFACQGVKLIPDVTLSIVTLVERVIDEDACQKIAESMGARFRMR